MILDACKILIILLLNNLDKNSVPKSTEAFQVLERAKDVLINPEKRKVYDEIIYSQLKKQPKYQESSGPKAEHGNKGQRRVSIFFLSKHKYNIKICYQYAYKLI